MNATWLFEWDISQDKPLVEFSQNEELVSFALLPDQKQSFVLFEGYLFDKHNFRIGQNATDAARVAEYYELYGEDLFSKLRGGYSLIIWDQDRQQLLAGRDGMGLTPLFYYWDHHVLTVSPSMDTLLQHPRVQTGFNRIVLAEYLQDHWPGYTQSETFFENILRLPPAHYLRFQNQSLSLYRYWDPVPHGFQWATQRETDSFREVFEQAVQRCLDVGADCIALSGGFDSVSIAVMANEILDSQAKPHLHAISIRYMNTGADEGEVQRAVASHLNMTQTLRPFDQSLEGTSVLQASLEMSDTNPIPSMSMWQSLMVGLMNIASREHNFSKMLMGTGGDEMFNVDIRYARDLFNSFQLLKLARYFSTIAAASPYPRHKVARYILWEQALRPGLTSILKKGLGPFVPHVRRLFRLNRPMQAPWISPADKTLLETLKYRREHPIQTEIFEGEGYYVFANRGLPQAPLLMLEMEQAFFRAKHSGFRLMFPFFDQDLVDLALRMHPEHLLQEGLAKAPLRKFVHDKLDGVQLPRRKVDFTQTAHYLMRSAGKQAWSRLEGENLLEYMSIIDMNQLNDFMNDYFEGKNDNWLQPWLALSTETWVRAYQKRLEK